MPGFHFDGEPETPGCIADLFQGGIGKAHARPAVDQQQLAFQRCQSQGTFGQHGVEQRPYPELLRAIALQRHFGDAAFDHLNSDPAVPDILRRNDRAAQVKPGHAVEVADGTGDGHKIGLRD